MVLSDLKAGLVVLFSGTPCQIAAIKSFAEAHKGYTGKLITVEILCFGVPSPQIFQEHIKFTECKYSEVERYVFRDERNGWGKTYIHSAKLKNGTELYDNRYLQAYASLFSKRLVFRESCFNCKFCVQQRCADLTIGDCWGVEYFAPESVDLYGVSQVWINTDKGREMWNKVKNRFITESCSIDQLLPYNSVLSRPAEKPNEYDDFWHLYQKKGFEFILKQYTRYGKTYLIRHKIRRLFEKIGLR